jgi:hypothetical protein
MLQTIVGALLALGLGALLVFFGRRVILVLLPVFGFFAGFWIGAEFMHLFLGTGFLGTISGWVLGIILALIGAVLSYLFFPIGVALLCGVFVASLLTGFLRWLGIEINWLLTLVGLVAGFIIAWLAFWRKWDSWIVIGLTALGGAMLMALGLAWLFGQVTTEQIRAAGSAISPLLNASIWWILLVAGLAVAGFIIQMRRELRFQYQQYDYVEVWGY